MYDIKTSTGSYHINIFCLKASIKGLCFFLLFVDSDMLYHSQDA